MNKLKDIKVLIDVGAKDTDYPLEYPKAICHLFEPNPIHFTTLQERFKDNKKVILNNYGLGEKEEMLDYDPHSESFVVGTYKDLTIQIKTLDWYLEENKIDRLDFLKIDTEAMDFEVLLGGSKAISLARYIQYEHWDDLAKFHTLLEVAFEMNYIGERNVLCTRK